MASSSIWTAPAELCGRGGAAMRPSLLGAVPAVQGSGAPFAGTALRTRDRVAIGTGFGPALIQKNNDELTQNDGTTLGTHSPGRPRS